MGGPACWRLVWIPVSASARSGSRAWLPTIFIILGLQEKAKHRQGEGRYCIGLRVGAAWQITACRRGPHTLSSEIRWRATLPHRLRADV
jgi:hypothetical protein